jgi:hypothetical protein
MLSFRLVLGGDADPKVKNIIRDLWSLTATSVLSVLNRTVVPSLADTSGLSKGAIATEPLLFPSTSAPTPQTASCRVFQQLFDDHNSSIHSRARQQPLLIASSDSYKDWSQAACVAASVVQLLHQASISEECLTSLDAQQSGYGKLPVKLCQLQHHRCVVGKSGQRTSSPTTLLSARLPASPLLSTEILTERTLCCLHCISPRI